MNLLAYWPLILVLALSGCVSGVFAGLLGVGGGVIIVPILSAVFEAMGFSGDVAQHVAVASSLAIIIPTGTASARSHFRRGAVDTETLRLWAPFVVGGTLVGGLLARYFTGEVLRIVFGVIALL
ncbi:MAG: sulfite exporter TauE/SafE family protein, partial [Devosia sp.]